MRCLSCNSILSDQEASKKYKGTNKYIDLCSCCFKEVEQDFVHPYIYEETDIEVDDVSEEE